MIVFDVVMMAGLVGTSIQPLKWSRPAGAIGAWVVLPIIGLLAGLGLFVLRLSGGPPAEYSPRAGQSRTASSAYPPDLEEFGKRPGAAMSFYQAAEGAAMETRWARTDADELRQLSREALKEYIARQRDLVAATDRVIALLSEPGFEANIARVECSVRRR